MKGSIRAIVGFILLFGAVGGLDTATDAQLYVVVLVACAGLAIMCSGVLAMKGSV
jgi:hypothetical protein